MAAYEGSGDLDATDMLKALRRRKGTVILTVTAVIGTVLAISFLQEPVYQSEVKVLLQPRASEQIFSPGQGVQLTDEARVQTEIEVMRSRSVREAAAKRLGHRVDAAVARVGETSIVSIRVDNADAQKAAHSADVYADTYLDTRRQQLVDDLLSAAQQVGAKVDDIRKQLDDLNAPIDALDTKIAQEPNATARLAVQAEREDAERRTAPRRQALTTQEAFYSQQLDQLQLAGNLTQTGGAHVVSSAEVATTPIRPTPQRDVILALIVGLIFGAGLALVFDHLDDTVRSKDDLQRASGGLNVLALVPVVPGWKKRDQTRLAFVHEPDSPTAEAYRSLRTSLQFLALERPIGLVQFCSPSASEGKTTTIANLAVALAQADQRVAIVCCDLRRPRVHEFFGLSNRVGFTSLLLGATSISITLQRIPGHERIRLLASGPTPPNPSELLSSSGVSEILAAVKAEVDIVLIDSPPLLPVTDGIVIAGYVDATVLVVNANSTNRKSVHGAVELLRQVDAPLVGAVLNSAESTDTYGYGRYAGNPTRSTPRRKRSKARENGTKPDSMNLPVDDGTREPA